MSTETKVRPTRDDDTAYTGKVVSQGLVAGAVGALAMAVWFLLIDLYQEAPFRTPALLANSLLGVENFETRPGAIAFYTVIHFAAFMIVGVGAAWVLSRMRAAPGILLGLVLGFILFNLVFYASVYVTGMDVVAALGWVEVLAGNLISGVTIMGYLHLTGVVRPVTWWDSLADHEIVKDGIVAGALGAGVVAAWFFAFDILRGETLFTPGALGSALFLGVRDVDLIQVTFWTVAGYTLVHLAFFVVVGLIASGIVWEAEETPPLILGGILLFVVFQALFFGLLAVVAEFLLGPLAWWSIAVGNVLAVVAMGYFLWRRHPGLKESLAADPFDRTH
jgi:hypothetical protein